MGTEWETEEEETGQQLWSTRIISASSDKDDKVASEAPEQIFLTFEELDILPDQIQGDNFYVREWVNIDQSSAVGLGGWNTIVYSGGTEND